MQQFYRRALWDDQSAYVEVWSEKDALTGVLYEVTGRWDVPLMVTRGFPSLSFLHSASETIHSQNKPIYIYDFGDHDPSGVLIPQKIEETLRELAPGIELHFERVAVTDEQIALWGLQTRPTKQTDSRSKNFEGESVEVDAIPPDTLRNLLNNLIESHVDEGSLAATIATEEAERATLDNIIKHRNGG